MDGINVRLDFEEEKIGEFEAMAVELSKMKHMLAIWSSNHTLIYLPKRRNTHLYENSNVQSFVQNNKELETTQTSIGLMKGYSHTMDYYSAIKEMHWYLQHMGNLKKHYVDSISMKLVKKENSNKSKSVIA